MVDTHPYWWLVGEWVNVCSKYLHGCRRYVECSMCRFATTCNNAYSNHMMALHSGSANKTSVSTVRNDTRMEQAMYCLCGYSSTYGNRVGRFTYRINISLNPPTPQCRKAYIMATPVPMVTELVGFLTE